MPPGRLHLSAPSFDFDGLVVGAGAIGLAVAEALARRGMRVAVLEKERGIGQGVSSRNSEVVHAGLYYPTGSLRARMCVEGRRRLYPFLESHLVAHERCGKLIVATDSEETPRLEALAAQAECNGVEGLVWLSGGEARAREPELAAEAALLSTQSGILDSHGFMLALLGEIEENGGVLARNARFLSAEPLDRGGFLVRTGGEAPALVRAERLVIAAGLGAQSAAAAIEGYPMIDIPPLRLGKGVYFRLAGPAPFRSLVYPLPIPGALGVHYTRDLAGQARFGPDLEFVAEEAYDIDLARADAFARAIRRYWPGLHADALEPDYAAIRPKIHGAGETQPDFRIDAADAHGQAGLVALFGIESPGLTASLAIAEHVADLLGGPAP
ncbi:MAG: NAD(P)/FAD-dependent oxidoreductase [Caulobacteraceae bacterium]